MTPSGPRKFFRKAVSSLNDWLKEAEEERDSLAEDLSVPPSNAKSASAPLQPSPPPFSTKAKNEDPKPPPVYELDGAETQPLDPAKTPHLKSNQRESSGSIVPQMYSNQRRIAGLKRRVDASPDSEIHKILTHSRNDTAYVERDEIVRLVRERYERYGETVASSVLTRALMPKGIEIR